MSFPVIKQKYKYVLLQVSSSERRFTATIEEKGGKTALITFWDNNIPPPDKIGKVYFCVYRKAFHIDVLANYSKTVMFVELGQNYIFYNVKLGNQQYKGETSIALTATSASVIEVHISYPVEVLMTIHISYFSQMCFT